MGHPGDRGLPGLPGPVGNTGLKGSRGVSVLVFIKFSSSHEAFRFLFFNFS